MNFIIWLIIGGLIGWVASMIMRTDGQQGIILNVIVGIVGAVLGGWLMNQFGEAGVSGFNLYSFAVALLGAVIFIVIVKFLRRL